MKQFLIDQKCQVGSSVTLKDRDFHYICHVRRHTLNQIISIKDPVGNSYKATIEGIHENQCILKVTEKVEIRNRGYDLELYCCFPKGKKLEGMVRQATEAGVSRIIPLFSDHSLIQYRNSSDFDNKKNRLNKIIKEAQQQSGSFINTVLEDPMKLSEIDDIGLSQSGFFCHQDYIEKNTLSDLLQKDVETVKILIGPEGGLSNSEILILKEKGFLPLYLGENVLRAETASLFAISTVITIMELL